MEFHGIEEFMRYLKGKYDASERKSEWRALTGRDHVNSRFDTFVFTDERVFQIKAVEVMPKNMAAVALEVGGPSPDLHSLIKGGSPVPLSMMTRSPDALSVMMFGTQQYSSEISDLLRREYYQSKQGQLDQALERNLKVLLERPEYKTAYRSLKNDQESYFG